MKKIMLKTVIDKHLKNAEFVEEYEKQLLINEISKLIVKLRKTARLTQKELAEKAGTTQPVIARLESGNDIRVPSLELLARIAYASNSKLHLFFETER
jgi:DNA-binding XRE family transcriptional regulator